MNWEPHTPVKLTKLSEFSEGELKNWLINEYDDLPEILKAPTTETVNSILEKSENGIPQLALEAICEMSGCDWYSKKNEWLKY